MNNDFSDGKSSQNFEIKQGLLRDRDKEPIPDTTYGKPQYDAVKGDRQRIELSRGCPHGCEYCYETKYAYAPTMEEVKQFPIPEIRKNYVEILDMNFLWQPDVKDRIRKLGEIKVDGKVVHYEEICGFDYRFLNQEICDLLKEARFVKPRIAWDGRIENQFKIKDTVDQLKNAGYSSEEIVVFMITNHDIGFEECIRKLDLLKVWSVKVCDCHFDGGYVYARKNPRTWTSKEMKKFRRKCRKHNQIVNFKIDPEIDAPDDRSEKLEAFCDDGGRRR